MKRTVAATAARAEGPTGGGGGGGARFRRKRDEGAALQLLPLAQLAPESLQLDDAITYPKNRFFAPRLLLAAREPGAPRPRPLLKLDGWLGLKFGVDCRTWDRGGGGGATAEASTAAAAATTPPEAVRLQVQLPAPLAAQLQALDARAEELLRPFVQDEQGRPLAWQPLVKRSERSPEPHAVVKAYLVARQGASVAPLTQLKLRLPGGDGCVRGTGWDFFQRHLCRYDQFRDGRCRLAVELQYWCMNGSAGLTLQAYALVLEPSEALCDSADGPSVDDVFPDAELQQSA
jgi:hypothetical protein